MLKFLQPACDLWWWLMNIIMSALLCSLHTENETALSISPVNVDNIGRTMYIGIFIIIWAACYSFNPSSLYSLFGVHACMGKTANQFWSCMHGPKTSYSTNNKFNLRLLLFWLCLITNFNLTRSTIQFSIPKGLERINSLMGRIRNFITPIGFLIFNFLGDLQS